MSAAVLAMAMAGGAASAAPAATFPDGQLQAVSASSGTNAWTVGCASNGPDECPGDGLDVVYHWNGTAWRNQTVPQPAGVSAGTGSAELTGVKAISAKNAWAVGTSSAGAQLVHWNGTAWKQVAVPALASPFGTAYSLSAVTATSGRNVWAVGNGGHNKSIILHYDGSSWQHIASPSPGSTILSGVVATSLSNAWAVGEDVGACACEKALILHWDGISWKVALNGLASSETFINSVSGFKSNAWAGGFTRASVNPTLLLHWNGKSWKRVAAGPKASQAWGDVSGVAVTSAKNAWAAGLSASSSILRWNGTGWKKATSSKQALSFFGMAAASASSAWAVGSAKDAKAISSSVLVLHWNGRSWKRQNV